MRVAIIAICMFVLAGCFGSSSVLMLKEYNPTMQISSHKSVLINSISDTRANQSIVATITDSKGSVEHSIMLGASLKDIFAKALKEQLRASGVTNGRDIIVDIEITEFSANLSGYSGENLKGKSKVIIKIKKGDTTITKTISQPQSKYVLLPRVAEFEPFITDMLNDMVLSSAKAILAN